MRAYLAGSALVAATLWGVTGCQSGTGTSNGWNLWGSKNKPLNHAAVAGSPSGAALPSATAAPAGSVANPALAANTWNHPSGALAAGTAAPAAAPSYYSDATAGPAAAAAAYPTTPYPDVAAANYTAGGNAAASYQTGAYDTGAAGPATAPAMAPQPGPYDAGGASTAAAADPYRAAVDPYQNASQYSYGESSYNPAASGEGYRTADASAGQPYGAATADPGAARDNPAYTPGTNYAPDARQYNTDANYADPRGDSRYAAPNNVYDPSAGYDPRSEAALPAEGAAPRGQAPSHPDTTPLDNAFQPGRTGYTPPGVQPYQANPAAQPAPANGGSYQRRDPSYRPGSTSDYQGAGRGAAAAQPAGGAVQPAGFSTQPRAAAPRATNVYGQPYGN